MKQLLKWTAIAVSAGAGALFAYRWIRAMRESLDRGLERVERVAESAERAVAHTQEALGQTAETAREIRSTIR